MHGKIMFALGAAVGYVVGSRSGREAYDRLKSQATEFWQDPRVQQKFSDAQDFAKEKIPAVGEKIKKSKDSSQGDGGADAGAGASGTSGSTGTPDPTAGTTPSDTEPPLGTPGSEGTSGNA